MEACVLGSICKNPEDLISLPKALSLAKLLGVGASNMLYIVLLASYIELAPKGPPCDIPAILPAKVSQGAYEFSAPKLAASFCAFAKF